MDSGLSFRASNAALEEEGKLVNTVAHSEECLFKQELFSPARKSL